VYGSIYWKLPGEKDITIILTSVIFIIKYWMCTLEETVEKEIEDFLIYQKNIKNATKNTLSAYRTDLKKWNSFLQENGVNESKKITETQINFYLLLQEKEGKSKATVNRSLVSIRSFLLYLMKQGKLIGDPTERIKPPKVEVAPPKYLTKEQVLALLSAPDCKTKRGIRDKAMLELMYATGMKVSEVGGLKKEDINLKFGCVTVREIKKNRVVPIGQAARESLETYLESEKQGNNESPYLFLGRQGEPMTRQGVWKIMKYYGKLIGLEEDLTPQVIRNSFAIHMIENGADLNSMKELMGHSNITATQHYTKQRVGETFGTYQKTHPRA
jgi:integrase/recombinase XerD